MIELILHSLSIGIFAFMVAFVFTNNGEIFGFVERYWSDKDSESMNRLQYLLWKSSTCEKCMAGQWSLILYLIHYHNQPCIYSLILTIGISTFTAWLLQNKLV